MFFVESLFSGESKNEKPNLRPWAALAHTFCFDIGGADIRRLETDHQNYYITHPKLISSLHATFSLSIGLSKLTPYE